VGSGQVGAWQEGARPSKGLGGVYLLVLFEEEEEHWEEEHGSSVPCSEVLNHRSDLNSGESRKETRTANDGVEAAGKQRRPLQPLPADLCARVGRLSGWASASLAGASLHAAISTGHQQAINRHQQGHPSTQPLTRASFHATIVRDLFQEARRAPTGTAKNRMSATPSGPNPREEP
jgi:hypothetical protein